MGIARSNICCCSSSQCERLAQVRILLSPLAICPQVRRPVRTIAHFLQAASDPIFHNEFRRREEAEWSRGAHGEDGGEHQWRNGDHRHRAPTSTTRTNDDEDVRPTDRPTPGRCTPERRAAYALNT